MADKLRLPLSVTSPSEVGRLVAELERIDEALLQMGLKSGNKPTNLPKASRLLNQTAETNKLNLLSEPDRALLKRYLSLVNEHAPRMHFSFAADPSTNFMEKLMDWLREQIHPELLVTIGLQPNLGAGCVVRTTNRQFDFSLGRHLAGKRELLLESMRSDASTTAP